MKHSEVVPTDVRAFESNDCDPEGVMPMFSEWT